MNDPIIFSASDPFYVSSVQRTCTLLSVGRECSLDGNPNKNVKYASNTLCQNISTSFLKLFYLTENGSCLKTGQHSIFVIKHSFLPIKYFFLFRIKDTVSDISSVLLNFIANYDSKNENIVP